jgi:hypothetical protein
LGMYNRPKWQCFKLKHLDTILLKWSRFLFWRKSSNLHLMININYASHIQILSDIRALK